MAATKVSVINFKGGVGKTTLAFHLAAYLAQQDKRVLMIDVDHQSSLSIVVLGHRLWEAQQTSGKTCNRIFESFCNRRVSMPGAEIIFKNPLHARQPKYDLYPTLDLVPAQFELDDTEIELASTTMGGPTVSEWSKRTLLAEWLDSIDVDGYDYVVFDCPPATKLVSQNAIAASNYFVVPVIPDELSSRGVTHFRHLVAEKIDKKLEFLRGAAGVAAADVPASYVPSTKMAGIVPFMAKSAGNAASGMTNIHTRQIKNLRKLWKADVVNTIVRSRTGIAESMEAGWPVWTLGGNRNVSSPVIAMLKGVCDELQKRMAMAAVTP
jgi:chromosome partitioning protein